MKILLIRPKPDDETIGLQHVMIVEPLDLEVIAATIPQEHEVIIVDMILETKPFDYFLKKEKPDVIAITGYITNVSMMISYCKTAKYFNPDITTIVGGVHLEVVPEDLNNEYIDYRVIRNATTDFPKLLNHINKKGELPQGVFKHNDKIDFDKLPAFDWVYPHPRRELTERYRKKYFYIFHNKIALIKTTFGCPYQCNYCFCRVITTGKYQTRPLNDVMDELKKIKEKEVYIVDDDFLISPARISQFLDCLDKHDINKKYLVYGRSDFIAENEELLKRFKTKGLRTIIVGFESFNDQELKKYNKMNNVNNNEKAMNVLNKLGIDCYATVMLAPEWGEKDFNRLRDELIRLKIKYVNLQPLTPIPGTSFAKTISEDRLVFRRDEFPKWDLAHVTVYPEQMSIAEYYLKIIKLYQQTVLRPSVLISHLKYPLSSLWKVFVGGYKVQKQYKKKYKEALSQNA